MVGWGWEEAIDTVLKLILVFVLMLLLARVGHCSTFPANRDSVPHENRVADSAHLKRYKDAREIVYAERTGTLVPLREVSCDNHLPMYRRYALPDTTSFAGGLNQEFHRAVGGSLTVDSAIRSRSDQRRLRWHNLSATAVDGNRASSHERGTTVDLSRKMTRGQYAWLIGRLGFYQTMGLILVIEERHCIHVFVVPGEAL